LLIEHPPAKKKNLFVTNDKYLILDIHIVLKIIVKKTGGEKKENHELIILLLILSSGLENEFQACDTDKSRFL